MKVFIFTQDLSASGQVWMNVFWPHYNAIAQSAPTEVIAMPNSVGEARWRRTVRGLFKGLDARKLRNEALAKILQADGLVQDSNEKYSARTAQRSIETIRTKLDPKGPNILLVWALRYSDLARTERLMPIWNAFDYKVLSIVDNLDTKHVLDKIEGRFDLITSFCGDLAQEFADATAIQTLYFPPHTDVLNFAEPGSYRPIDFFVVGRRDPEIHTPLHLHYNRPGSERISIDYISRSVNFAPPREVEFQLLLSAYGRSKMAFCFEASAIDRFQNRSPLTERWVHSWAGGCSVIGQRPSGAGVAQAIDWPDATIDLPTDPEAAREMTDSLLADEAGMRRRRLRNVEEALRQHDTRHRLARILDELDVKRPEPLQDGLKRLTETADALARERETG